MGFAHGKQDAQKTMGIIALAIFGRSRPAPWTACRAGCRSSIRTAGEDIDTWIIGTCAHGDGGRHRDGGWRIIKTLGHQMVKLHPIDGFAAETASATILVTASNFGMPVSTTHSISTAIMGVGFGKNPRKLKISVIERIIWAWILTILAAGGFAYLLLRLAEAMGWT